MPSTPARPAPPPPRPTVRLRPDRPPAASSADALNTDYELAPAVALGPAVRFVDETEAPPAGGLDPETRAVFQRRLALCCVVAAAPFAFFTACAATNFIDLLGRSTVGWSGLGLSAATLAGLAAIAGYLSLRPGLGGNTLRALEVAVFGVMGLFFAYFQFQVLTAQPLTGFDSPAHERMAVLAGALVGNFNWFALLVFHGVLVPNSPARGAGVAAAMCATALGIDAMAAASHPPTGDSAGPVFAVSLTLLAAGAGLSIFGTAKTAALRQEVASAREAVRELGQYRLRRKLGHGGMGEVYLAEHRLLKRPCALKRIHPRFLDHPEQVRRFEREVQATAQLRHPNTVEIYDYGRAADGTFYYVMEYLPGLSLEDVVQKAGPLPPDRVVHILRQVCSALAAAHRAGLVHRDVKPSNILVFPSGTPHDHAKVVDFGLVHSLVWDGDPGERITREGLIVGTPEYMSPEQASGGDLDGRSDLFSLGAVAYFLLTGKEVFHRENPMKTLMAVVNDPADPPAAANPAVPADLSAVVMRCLGKFPADRYATAAELEAALAGCGCAGGWTEPKAAAWWAAHPGSPAGVEPPAPVKGSSGGG